MDPRFVADWEKTQDRFDAWWRGEIIDRPPTAITASRETPRWPLRPMPEDPEPSRKYLDIEYRIDEIENTLATTDYFGDAIPNVRRGVNTAYLGSFAGAVPLFEPTTVWVEPFVKEWDAMPRPVFDTETPLFKNILEVAEAVVENARGRYLPSLPDHLDAVTSMSQMRGVEDLCLDLVEDPEPAARFRDALTEVWKQSFDFWFAWDRERGIEGTLNWASAYSRRRVNVTQCDFSALISPAMFESFVRPELAAEAAHLEGTMYHLDGPGQIPHVDILCDIPGLTAVQWVVGAGNPPPVEWPELLTRLQERGKSIQVFCALDHFDRLFEFLKPEGVFFVVGGAADPEACREALKKVDRWAAGRQ